MEFHDTEAQFHKKGVFTVYTVSRTQKSKITEAYYMSGTYMHYMCSMSGAGASQVSQWEASPDLHLQAGPLLRPTLRQLSRAADLQGRRQIAVSSAAPRTRLQSSGQPEN